MLLPGRDATWEMERKQKSNEKGCVWCNSKSKWEVRVWSWLEIIRRITLQWSCHRFTVASWITLWLLHLFSNSSLLLIWNLPHPQVTSLPMEMLWDHESCGVWGHQQNICYKHLPIWNESADCQFLWTLSTFFCNLQSCRGINLSAVTQCETTDCMRHSYLYIM